MKTTHLSTLFAAALSMTTGEFVEVQQMGPDDLRSRFGLPASCEPSVVALSTDPAVNWVTVAVDCRVRVKPEPTDPSGPRPRPARPPAK